MHGRHIAVALSALFVLSACEGSLDEAATDSEGAGAGDVTTRDVAGPVDAEPQPAEGAAAGEDADAPADEAGDGAGTEGAGFGGAGEEEPTALGDLDVVRSGERVIKEGTMTLEVEEGAFLRAYQRVVATAREAGGHVTASTSRNTDDGGTWGSVTVRVPVDRYEDLLTRIGEIGTLREQDIASRDVTAEFTDLESRLRHLQAQERFYLGLLEEAETVQDAIAVKQQLDGIQSQIEQTRGRLGVLEDRTSYSTLTVELVEPGAEPVVAATGARPMLADYWETARNGFVVVVGWILVTSVSLAPLLLPLLLAGLAWRLMRRRPPATAAVAAEGE